MLFSAIVEVRQTAPRDQRALITSLPTRSAKNRAMGRILILRMRAIPNQR